MEADKRGGHTVRGCKYLLGGAMSGWFTPTEAGMVAAAYTFRRSTRAT